MIKLLQKQNGAVFYASQCSKDAKHSNRNNFICVQDIDTIFVCIIGFSGSANQIHYLKFQGAKGVTMATKFGQKSQNCTYFTSAQEIKDFLHY